MDAVEADDCAPAVGCRSWLESTSGPSDGGEPCWRAGSKGIEGDGDCWEGPRDSGEREGGWLAAPSDVAGDGC